MAYRYLPMSHELSRNHKVRCDQSISPTLYWMALMTDADDTGL